MDASYANKCGFAPPSRDVGPDRSPDLPTGWGLVVALAPAWLILAIVLVHGPQAGSLDDAFVVWSDARDLAFLQGVPDLLGASGGAVPVEGSTSLLDVALKSLALRVWPGLDPLRFAGWMGLAWLLLAILVVARAILRWTGSVAVAALIASFVAVSPGLVESAGYLLEGPLFALLWILGIVAAVEARPRRCVLWCLLAAAARPEGLLLAPVLAGWSGLRRFAASGQESLPRAKWRAGWTWASVGLGCSLLVTALRWMRYGDLLPNTYYAKASDSFLREVLDGAAYLHATVWGPVGLGLAWAAWMNLRRVGTPPTDEGSARLGLVALSFLYAAGVMASGGDSYEGARLFMPIALPLWLGLGLSLGACSASESPSGSLASHRPAPSKLSAASGLLVLLALLFATIDRRGREAVFEHPLHFVSATARALQHGPVGLEAFEGDAETFRAVAQALGDDGVFAHVHTQRFRWFEPNVRVMDLTGLTDRKIARLPAEGVVRFGRFALAEALSQRAGAIHLDPGRARPTSIVDAPSLARALFDPDVASRYVGAPFVDEDLANAVAEEYVGASRVLSKGQGYFNLLVHESLAEDFRQEGFRVAVSRPLRAEESE